VVNLSSFNDSDGKKLLASVRSCICKEIYGIYAEHDATFICHSVAARESKTSGWSIIVQ